MKKERISIVIPKNFYPSKEAFENLGFEIEELEEEEIMAIVYLPEGWYSKNKSIFDSKDRKRAEWEYQSPIYGESGKTRLICRYSFEILSQTYLNVGLVKDYDGRILYQARQENQYNEVRRKTKKIMNEKFPGWEDPTKYWD